MTRPCTWHAADKCFLVYATRRCNGSSSSTSTGHRYECLHGCGAFTWSWCLCVAHLTAATWPSVARTYSPALSSAARSRDGRTRSRHARSHAMLRRVYDGRALLSSSSADIKAGEHRRGVVATRSVLGQVDDARHDGQGLEGRILRRRRSKCERTGLLRSRPPPWSGLEKVAFASV